MKRNERDTIPLSAIRELSLPLAAVRS